MIGRSLLAAASPTVAVEIAPRRVAAVSVALHGSVPVITGGAVEPLPAGAVVPSLTGTNMSDRGSVAGALARVFERMGARPRRAALVIPDSVAKVSILRLDKVPTSAQDLDQLIRWHVRKAAPFRIEDAQIAYGPGAAVQGGGREFVVAVARRDVVQEYEQVCQKAGTHAGLVDLATFNLLNLVLAAGQAPQGDWLLVNVTAEYSTMGIMRGRDLIFYRNLIEEGQGHLADLVHQTAMYYEDRLSGQGFARVLLLGGTDGPAAAASPAGRGADELRRTLQQRLGVGVEAIDVRKLASVGDRTTVDAALAPSLAPLLGVLLRERVGG